MELTTLPEVIFRLLQTFLTNDDYHYLLNTSKQHFSDLKRRTIYFQLTEVHSKQYMTDKLFQSYVLSLVEDGWKQIRVYWKSSTFMSWYDQEVPSDCSEFVPYLYKTPPVMSGILSLSSNVNKLQWVDDINSNSLGDVSHISKFQLRTPDNILDLALFRNIPDLEIAETESDVSIFSKDHQRRLCLTECYNLTNVENFKGIHILKLLGCDGVEDISPLHGIYDLSLLWCSKIKNISGLGNHHRLYVEYCSENLIGYESLGGIPHVTLIRCDISDVSVFRDVKSIKLSRCDNLVDIRSIKNAKRVELFQCRRVTNIIELCDVYDLSIDEFMISVSELPKLRNYLLTIKFPLMDVKGDTDKPYEKFSDECFSYTSHLTLSNIPISVRKWFEEGNVSFLNHLQSLTISSSVNIFSGSIEYAFNFPRLENIPLVILNSLEVKTVAGLRNNRCVVLRGCKGIEDIESLSSVKVLTIDKCIGNYDDNVFSKVPRLKLMKASNIK